jgi:hypothetical protein
MVLVLPEYTRLVLLRPAIFGSEMYSCLGDAYGGEGVEFDVQRHLLSVQVLDCKA